jgi:DNA-binding transcriptional ArsR family regulator
MLSNSTTQSSAALAAVLRAAADPGRLRLLRLCADRPTSVSELSHATGESEPNVSRQLKQLAGAGLLQRVRRGQRVEYLPTPAAGLATPLLQLLLTHLDPTESALREARARLRALEKPQRVTLLAASRLGRTLRGALGTAWVQDLAARRVLVRSGFRELLEGVRGAATETVLWCRDAHEARGVAADTPRLLTTELATPLATAARFDAIVLAPELAEPAEQTVEYLTEQCALIASALSESGIAWLIVSYDTLDDEGNAPARLRRLLAAQGFDCLALIPVEAEGEHVLAARVRLKGVASRLPLTTRHAATVHSP